MSAAPPGPILAPRSRKARSNRPAPRRGAAIENVAVTWKACKSWVHNWPFEATGRVDPNQGAAVPDGLAKLGLARSEIISPAQMKNL